MSFRIPPGGGSSATTRAITNTVRRVTAPKRPAFVTPRIPGVYDPAQIPGVAHQQAETQIQGQLAGLPTIDQVSQPYATQNTRIDQYTQGLIDQLKGATSYGVNLATGLPQAELASGASLQSQAAQDAARLGGTAPALPTTAAAGTLAAFGTSAANELAAQQAAAPSAGMMYHEHVNDQLTQALNQLTQQRSGILGQEPALEQAATGSLNDAAYKAMVTQQNYDLAKQQADALSNYRTTSVNAGVTKTKISAKAAADRTATTTAAADARAAAGRQNAYRIAAMRVKSASATASANRDAAGQRAAEAAANKKASQIASLETRLNSDVASRYKPTAGKAGGTTGYDVAYSYVDTTTDATKTGTKHITPQQYQAYKAKGSSAIGLPAGAKITGTTPRTSGGTAGRAATNPDRVVNALVSQIAQQNETLGWGLTRDEMTRMAQQTVRSSNYWPNYGRNTAKRSATPKASGTPAKTAPPADSYGSGRKRTG